MRIYRHLYTFCMLLLHFLHYRWILSQYVSCRNQTHLKYYWNLKEYHSGIILKATVSLKGNYVQYKTHKISVFFCALEIIHIRMYLSEYFVNQNCFHATIWHHTSSNTTSDWQRWVFPGELRHWLLEGPPPLYKADLLTQPSFSGSFEPQ